MTIPQPTPQELWRRQQIGSTDVDYDWWEEKRTALDEFSRLSQSCLFTVDVFQERYDFASDRFAHLLGYPLARIRTIRQQGDWLEENIHPVDREQLTACQIKHAQFIYSLPPAERNDYRQTFRFRMLNAERQYLPVVSRQEVIAKDKNGKAWIVLGMLDLFPQQITGETFAQTVINIKTGQRVLPASINTTDQLTRREKEILLLIRRGLLSKEIAHKLNLSIYTVNNHRKNILSKLHASNVLEAIRRTEEDGSTQP